MLCNSGVPLVPDCLYQVSGMAYLFGPCMSVFTAMPRPGYLLRMILPVKTQCRRHRRVMEVILLKQKQIKCPYCHAHASLRPASLVYGSTPQTRGKFLYVCDRWPACNAYVSAHERTLLPMGTLANGDLRHKRILAHRALKKLQQDCHMENGRSISGCKPNWGLMHTRPTSASFPNICVSKSFPSVSRLRRTHPGVLPERR